MFDDASVQRVITNIAELREKLPAAMTAALVFFPGVDRTVGGYEGLIRAQTQLPDDACRDAFALAYSHLGQLWEAISPDAALNAYETDYKWLSDVYESIKPSDYTGRQVWHSLGAKTLELINENVTVEVPRSDLETIVLDAVVIEDLSTGGDRDKKVQELEKQITGRIAKHLTNPTFVALGQRLGLLKV